VVLDVFAKDVDFVSSWYTVMSLLVGCLPLMGTWDRRKRSILGRFTEMGGAEKTATEWITMCLSWRQTEAAARGSAIEHGGGTLLYKVTPFLPIDGLLHHIDSAMARSLEKG